MSEIFLTVVNMSISASWVVLAVLFLRTLFIKAPKWIAVLLWGIVAVRLICPFSVESIVSLIPSAETISPEIMMDKTPEINTGVSVINNMLNPIIGETLSSDPAASANPLQIWIPVLSVIWIIGVTGMILYTIISYFRVKRKIATAVLLRDNIFQSESVVSPFVFGIIKTKIYLPFNLNEQDMEHVIAHEESHIRRKDHCWKPLGFLILMIHWFNPLMWLGYVLFCRDIEFACDEKVIRKLNMERKADYSQALLTCSVNRRMSVVCPLAFGEVGVKDRVKTILNYKKPAFWVIAVAIITSVVAAVCFLTNPASNRLKNIENRTLDANLNETSADAADSSNVKTFETTVSYASRLEASEVYFGALNNDKMTINSVQHLPIYKFDTLYDLEQFKQSFGDRFLMDRDWDEVPSFNAVTAKYDSVFFEDNSLLLIYVSATNSTHRFNVHSVGYADKSFCVHITETTKAECVDTAMAAWFVMVAVPDELIKNCTEFDAIMME